MGLSAAALTACSSEPDERCVDRDSHSLAQGRRGRLRPERRDRRDVVEGGREAEDRREVAARVGRRRLVLRGQHGWVDGGSFAGPDRSGGGSSDDDAAVRDEPGRHQRLTPLPAFDGDHVVLGARVVRDEPAGLGLRESAGLITDGYARFLPHA